MEPVHNILLIEYNAVLKDRIQTLLASKGEYTLHSFSDEKAALLFLKTFSEGPFSLIISSYKMSGMKGDEILFKAREISPESRRMLVGDISDIDTIINAINKADIHYCLVLPFTDNDLIQQIRRACADFQEIKKREHLKRITQRQNKQLFMMASDLKKKSEREISQIKSHQADIKDLKIRLAGQAASKKTQPGVSLNDVLTKRGVESSSSGFGRQFSLIQTQVRQIFQKIMIAGDIRINDVSYEKIRKNPAIHPEYRTIAIRMLPLVLNGLMSWEENRTETEKYPVLMPSGGFLGDFLELGVSKDGLTAYIRMKKKDLQVLNTDSVKECLAYNHVISGLILDQHIETWLKEAPAGGEPFIIAQGKPFIPPEDARVHYHFPVDYRQAGTLRTDGSLDFTDRGKIPFVQKDTLLAAKEFAVPGTPGRTVLGEDIPVPEPNDISFAAGPGTRISGDGAEIYADIDGQPHLDSLGNIFVLKELEIKGDIGFETGNIEFDGNLVVKGVIHQGFKVKAASLTIEQVHGAEITLTGDLNVSAGIIDAHLVKVGGNIQAKYINNSIIDAFGDLRVQNEIIDSVIRLSGQCINPTGSIIASRISAKMGIEAGNIGTTVSKPAILAVGMDAYVDFLAGQIKLKQHMNRQAIGELKNQIMELEKENQVLHAVIAEYAHIQDRSQLELREMKRKRVDQEQSGDIQAFHEGSQALHILEGKIKSAEDQINKGFQRQDEIAVEISQLMSRIQLLEKKNESLESEKQGLYELTEKKEPVPRVKVTRKIMPGTRIEGPHSFLIVQDTVSKCEIAEMKRKAEMLDFHEMKIIQ